MSGSLAAVNKPTDECDGWHLETLGVSETEREGIKQALREGFQGVDPVVSYLVSHTNGIMYKHLVGHLTTEPIPTLDLPSDQGRTFLDIGCGWGRWCIAAARLGYRPVGLDPSLGAVLAAQRTVKRLGVDAKFVVGDARWLPFREGAFEFVHSYSVIQHFSLADAEQALREGVRVLKHGHGYQIQLANRNGVRSLYHQACRRFRQPQGFEVRYWPPSLMRKLMNAIAGEVELECDCFFGLGLQKADGAMMPLHKRIVLGGSEALKWVAKRMPSLRFLADSLYVRGTKKVSSNTEP